MKQLRITKLLYSLWGKDILILLHKDIQLTSMMFMGTSAQCQTLYCPHQGYHAFSSKKTDCCVLEMKVYCLHKALECTWVELHDGEKHLDMSEDSRNSCPFVEVPCTYLCGKTILRRSLPKHMQTKCELHRVNCKYCGLSDSYKLITTTHLNPFPNYSLQCQNKCKAGSFRVNEIKNKLMFPGQG